MCNIDTLVRLESVRKVHRIFINLFGIALLLGIGGCAVNPVTGESEIALVSDAQAVAIGQRQYLPSQQMQGGEMKIVPELSTYVSDVGQRLARASGVSLPYEFVVLNNGTPNAWALPGGKICLLYTSPSPRDREKSRMPSSA